MSGVAAAPWGIGPSQSATMRQRQRPPLPEWTGDRRAPASFVYEKRVPQYGPEWMDHVVVKGGDVRDGNILLFPAPRRRKR